MISFYGIESKVCKFNMLHKLEASADAKFDALYDIMFIGGEDSLTFVVAGRRNDLTNKNVTLTQFDFSDDKEVYVGTNVFDTMKRLAYVEVYNTNDMVMFEYLDKSMAEATFYSTKGSSLGPEWAKHTETVSNIDVPAPIDQTKLWINSYQGSTDSGLFKYSAVDKSDKSIDWGITMISTSSATGKISWNFQNASGTTHRSTYVVTTATQE